MSKRLHCRLSVLFALIALTLMLVAPLTSVHFSAYADDSQKEITVFSWEDYIEDDDESSVLSDFEQESGIKINYYTFATCEEMYNELIKNPNACDLMCPSEYMILKMRDEGLIQAYTAPENYQNNVSPYIESVFENLGLNTADGKTYATGYMWGTMGLIYNADKFTAEDFKSWTDLYSTKFSKKITIKDSLRDSYIMTLGIVYKDELLELKNQYDLGAINSDEYNEKINEIFNRTDKQTVKMVGDALIDLKSNLYGFEVDAGKSDLLTGKIDVNFAWSGDAVYSMFDADDNGKTLGYAVPEEGSNVWFDGWVMTNSADVENSLAFINFISRTDIAVRNMDYVGYTSCIAGNKDDTAVFDYVVDSFGYSEEDELAGEERVSNDLSYFFGEGDFIVETGFYTRHLFAQYSNEQTIMRCAVMDNFSNEDLELVNEMWNKVKLITLPDSTLIIVAIVIGLIIVACVAIKFSDKIFSKNISTEQTKPRRKNCKVVKIEKI